MQILSRDIWWGDPLLKEPFTIKGMFQLINQINLSDIGHKGRRLLQDMHVLNTLERIDESSENSTRDQIFHFEENLQIMNFVVLGRLSCFLVFF